MDKPMLVNMDFGDLFKRERFAKKKHKRQWSHATRHDRQRQARGIPADAGPALLHYRRQQVIACRAAKTQQTQKEIYRRRRAEFRLGRKPMFEAA